MEAHMMCAAIYERLGDKQKSEFHHAVLLGLEKSIANSGDWKTAATAFVVIAVPEEYQFLGLNGFAVRQQALVESKDGPMDVMTTVDRKTNQTRTFYFNISRPLGALGRQLEGVKPRASAP
jgi:hypothetical protein